jgi:hypothetical protein
MIAERDDSRRGGLNDLNMITEIMCGRGEELDKLPPYSRRLESTHMIFEV